MTRETPTSGVCKAAILAAVRNRRDVTERWLASLQGQTGHHFTVRAFVVDDGSTDGTAEVLQAQAGWVQVIQGDGNLYWAGGMRAAYRAAQAWEPDVFILMNDDVALRPTALALAADGLGRARALGPEAILVGSTADPVQGSTTYGGFASAPTQRLRMTRVEPSDELAPADTMNGNFVLVPCATMHRLGGISERYTHGLGDIDLGFRARDAGIPIYVLPGYVGTCDLNLRTVSDGLEKLTFRAFMKKLSGPKGFPVQEWFHFTRRFAGPLWPAHAMAPYVRLSLAYLARRTRYLLARQAAD